MNRIAGWVVATGLISLVSGCGGTVDLEAEKIELLRIHRADIRAHVDGDVDALLKTIGPDFISVVDGRVEVQTGAEVREFFTRYLAGASYDAYEDLKVPHAEVADDGSMGWVISKVAVSRREPDGQGGSRTRSFTCTGIMTYEKTDGKWMKVANVSTFSE